MSVSTVAEPAAEAGVEPQRSAPARRRRPAPPPATFGRPSAWELARTFNPDRRWFHPFLAATWLYVLAAVPRWAGLPVWSVAVVGVLGTALAVIAACRRYPVEVYGPSQRRAALILTVTAGAAGTAWLLFAATVRPTALRALAALLLGSLLFGCAYALIKTKAPARKTQVEQEREHERVTRLAADEAQQERVEQQRTRSDWEEILANAKLTGLTVLEKTPSKAGYTLRLDNHPSEGITFADLFGAREKIANAASHKLGLRLRMDQIEAEETDSASEFLLHVTTVNVFAGPIPYPLDRPVGTIRNPIRPAVYRDGLDVELAMLGVHTCMVGGTGSGKSVFTHNVIAECTHCSDNLVWIAASDKIVPLVYPWLYPWFAGMTRRPVIDRIAGQDPRRVLQLLADGYKISKLRNGRLGPQSKFLPTPGDPAISILLEEASDLLMDHKGLKIKTFDGKELNATQLINAITRMSRSAGVSVYLVTQFGLMDALGNEGNMAKRNITQRIAAKTQTAYDGTATLVGMRVDTTRLRDHTVLIQPSAETPRVIPAKAYELDGVELIAPIAARNTANQPRLAAWLQAELGASYTDRWNPKHHPELAEVMAANGFSWPSLDQINVGGVDDEFTAIVKSIGDTGDLTGPERPSAAQDADPATTAEPSPDTTELFTRPSTQEEIQTMQETADKKMDEAIESFRKWGSLGETMSKISEKIRAANAPDFISARALAFVIDRVDQDGDRDAAARALIAELAGNPWQLATTTRDGQEGWTRAALHDRIKAYLTGEVVPLPREATDEPLTSILDGLRDRADSDTVSTGDLALLCGRVNEDEDAMRRRGAAISLGRELGAAPWYLEAERTRDGSVYRVGDLRQAAADVAAGIDRAPTN